MKIPEAPNPYIGPRPFQQGEPLYGRTREVQEVRNLLISERLLLLYSPSGAGKSSLIQAALIPLLKRKRFHIHPILRVGTLPAADLPSSTNRYSLSVLLALEEARAKADQLPIAALVSTDLGTYLDRRRATEGQVDEVLIFDQFEEVLTRDPTDQLAKEIFFEELSDALRDRRRWALFAVREDYLGALDSYRGKLPGGLAMTYRLDLLDRAAALEAIREPARAAGRPIVDLAASQLVDDLRRVRVQQPDGSVVEQLGPYVEPVQLQVVCRGLWERLPPDSLEITPRDVAAAGDVDTALASYYATSVATVAVRKGVPERRIRAWCEEQLIASGGLRNQVLQAPKVSAGLENQVIRALVDTHLIRAEERRGVTWFELSHDRLVEPIRTNNRWWRETHYSWFQQQARVWERQDRPDGLLLRGSELRKAMALAKQDSTDITLTEQEFLATSQNAQKQRQRNRILMGTGLLLFIMAFVLVVYFAVQANTAARHAEAEAENARNQAAVANSRAVAAKAGTTLDDQLDLGLLLGIAANSITDTIESRSTLLAGIEHSPHLIRFLHTHSSAVTGVAFNPSGKTLASVGLDNQLILWDLSAGHVRQAIESTQSGGLTSVAFTPDGQLIATGSRDGSIQLWDGVSGQPVGGPMLGHTAGITSVAFSPDGQTLAAGSLDKTVRLWNTRTRQQITAPLAGHTDSVESIAFSADGKLLASASLDKSIRIWDAHTMQPMGIPLIATSPLHAVVFDPQGNTLASGGSDGRIALWSLVTYQTISSPFAGHTDQVWSLAFSPDGQILASGSVDQTIRLWDVSSRRPLDTPWIGHSNAVLGLAFSPDGRMLASGSDNRQLILWDVAEARPGNPTLLANTDGVNSVAFQPTGHLFATAGSDKTIAIWESATRRMEYTLTGHIGSVEALAFSPDGQALASGGQDQQIY